MASPRPLQDSRKAIQDSLKSLPPSGRQDTNMVLSRGPPCGPPCVPDGVSQIRRPGCCRGLELRCAECDVDYADWASSITPRYPQERSRLPRDSPDIELI